MQIDHIKIDDNSAYIELREFEGKLNARMNFFDSDYFKGYKEIVKYRDALNKVVEMMEKLES